MNWGQYNDSLCYLCLPGTVGAFLFLTQEIVGLKLAVLGLAGHFGILGTISKKS